MSLKSVIESMPNEIPSFVKALTSDKLIDALKTAQKKYGKPVTGFFTGKLLFKRIPEPDFIKEHAQLSLAIILLGEGSFNLTSFKYLVLEALEFIPDNARAELAKLDKKLLETYLQNIYQLILSQLISAEVIKGYSEALNNKPGEAFVDFLDRLSQYWVESIHSSADAAAGEGLSPLQFKLSPEAMDELCSQLEKMDDLSITTKSEPRADWPTRAFLLWGQKLKAASFECLDLRRKLYLLDEFKWQAFGKALKDSGITSLDLSENNDLHKLDKDQWQAFCEALKGSGITSLDLSRNNFFVLNKDQWQAFGEALKDSGITSLILSDHDLNELNESKWQAFCEALKDSGITSLVLWSDLHKLEESKWQAFGEALKGSGITSLDLNANGLHKLDKDQWQAFCRSLQGSGITSLDLSWSDLSELDESKWQAFGEALKGSGITSLVLSRNDLYKLDESKWQAFCEALKGSGITSLVLCLNGLHKLNEFKWQAFGEALKGSGITSLVLSRNDLSELDESKWQTFCEALKGSGITSLDLSWNDLYKLDESKWQAFCEALKGSGITSLDLSENGLDKLDKDQWQTFGEALKGSGITSLDLSRNGLYKLDESKWQAFCEALKGSGITSLVLCLNGLHKLNESKWQAFGEALKGSDITSLDLNKNNRSLSHWKMLLKALSTDRKTPLILKEINFSKFSEKEAHAFFQLLKRHYPAFKIYQPVPEGFEGLYKSLSNLKKEITLLTSPASNPEEEENSNALISKLDAEYDKIKYLNELDYLALFNEYYFAAFLLAKVGHQPQVALEALESINLTPVIDYPDKEQLNAELLHAVLDYALMLDTLMDEFADAMHQATQKLFKQAGQGEDYYRAIFNQRTLDLDKVNTLLSEIKTMQKKVSAYLDSKVNAEANFFGKAPKSIQKFNQHLNQFLATLEEKAQDEKGVLLYELADFLDDLTSAALKEGHEVLFKELTELTEAIREAYLPQRNENSEQLSIH